MGGSVFVKSGLSQGCEQVGLCVGSHLPTGRVEPPVISFELLASESQGVVDRVRAAVRWRSSQTHGPDRRVWGAGHIPPMAFRLRMVEGERDTTIGPLWSGSAAPQLMGSGLMPICLGYVLFSPSAPSAPGPPVPAHGPAEILGNRQPTSGRSES